MKHFAIITLFFFSSFIANAQETYTINGEALQLKTEVEGKIDLLWNIIDNEYRYFVRTEDNKIIELVNTKNDANDYQEQYKSTLRELTNNTPDVSKVKLTLSSLITYIDKYNTSYNPSYASTHPKFISELRLGVFGGVSNSPFISNPENVKSTVIGGEFEVLGSPNRRHSGYLQLRHVAEKDEFKYKTTEVSLGYRFRFIKISAFSLYADLKFATLNFTKAALIYEDDEPDTIPENIDETTFDLPFILGVGTDIKLSEVIYINISYNQLYAVFLDNQGNTSSDVTFGLKFKLN